MIIVETNDQYVWALSEIDKYFKDEPVKGTPEAERFDSITSAVAAYEVKHFPVQFEKEKLDKCIAAYGYVWDNWNKNGKPYPIDSSNADQVRRAAVIAAIAEWETK